jgi:hypothetical protein
MPWTICGLSANLWWNQPQKVWNQQGHKTN